MTSVPLNPLDVPPYQLQQLLSGIGDNIARQLAVYARSRLSGISLLQGHPDKQFRFDARKP